MGKKGKEQSPFATAMNQGTDGLSEKQLKGALDESMNKLSKMSNLANVSKEKVLQTGTNLMHAGETMGSLFLSSMMEGYFGDQKMKIGGVDVRAPAGLAMQGYGLYQILNGNAGSGEHFLALGNGVTGSWLANVGVDSGKALAERRAAKGAPPPTQTQVPGTPGMHGNYGPQMSGPLVHVPPMPDMAGYGGFGAQFPGAGYGQGGYGQSGYLPAPGMVPAGYQHAPGPNTAGMYPDVSGPAREIMQTPEGTGAPQHAQVMLTPERASQARGPQSESHGAGKRESEVSGRMVPVRPLSRVPRARAPEAAEE